MSDRGGTVDWFLSTQGRIARIVAGSLLIILGLGIIGGFFGVVLLIIGAVPIASAAYGTFLLAPFFGRDIYGRREGGAPTDEEPEPEEDDDGEAREDESGQEQGGSRRGEESAEEPQEQLEQDAPGDTTATRDEDAGDGRRGRTSSGGAGEDGGDSAEDRPESSRGGDDAEDRPESSSGGDDAQDRPAPSRGGDAPTGARPMRAERPPDQGPRTKDLRAEDPGSSGGSGR